MPNNGGDSHPKRVDLQGGRARILQVTWMAQIGSAAMRLIEGLSYFGGLEAQQELTSEAVVVEGVLEMRRGPLPAYPAVRDPGTVSQ